jgi:hypothetical protein
MLYRCITKHHSSTPHHRPSRWVTRADLSAQITPFQSETSKGGLYFHFPNKQTIFLALVQTTKLTPSLPPTSQNITSPTKKKGPTPECRARVCVC